MIVFALATGHKIAIGVMGAIFIAFALVSSFVLPRRNPNFPNRNVGLYVLATVVLFAAMLTTILVFGIEEESGNAEPGATETQPGTRAAGGGGEEATGDAAAGKTVFASAGCSGCHSLEAAG